MEVISLLIILYLILSVTCEIAALDKPILQTRKQRVREGTEQEQEKAPNVQLLSCELVLFYCVAASPAGTVFNDIFNNSNVNNWTFMKCLLCAKYWLNPLHASYYTFFPDEKIEA